MNAPAEILPLTEIIQPADHAAVVEAVKSAQQSATPIYPFGGGTRLDYGVLPKRPGLGYGIGAIYTLASDTIGSINQHQGIIDHHADQAHDTKQAQEAEVVSHNQVAHQRAYNTKGDGRHHDQRLGKRPKRNSQQGVDAKECDDKALHDIGHRLFLFLSFALYGVS